MRILFVDPVGTLGGAERVLIDVIASLRPVLPARSAMHLICLGDGDLPEVARAAGASAEVLALPRSIASLGESGMRGGRIRKMLAIGFRLTIAMPALVRFIFRLRRIIRDWKPDVVHCNGLKVDVLSRLFPTGDTPIIWHVHDFLENRPLIAGLMRLAARKSVHCIAISDAVARDLAATLPGVAASTVINAIDTDHFSPRQPGDDLEADGWLDRLAGLPPIEHCIRIGLIATYARWKGHALFLDAAKALISTDVAPVRFYIVGGSVYQTSGSQFSRRELIELRESLGLTNDVGLIDFQKDPIEVYRQLDIVVHASTKPEPFGRTIVEAMACGKPVIVAAAGGAVEIATDQIDALTFKPGDVHALTARMRQMITDADMRNRLRSAARATAVGRFSRDRIGPAVFAVYRRRLATN